jgi:hypothetical protein
MSPEPPALTREVSRPADVETHEEPEEVVESKVEQQVIVDNQQDEPEEENVAVNPEEKTEDPVVIDEIKEQDQEVAVEGVSEQPESSCTGKTLLAKAIAGETSCAFMSLSGSSFDEGDLLFLINSLCRCWI